MYATVCLQMEERMMNNNLQFRRTHKAIIQAFITLARKKSFEKISVQDILDEALVSRYTFYKHFKDKYEIAEFLQEQTLQEFQSVMRRYRSESAYPEPIRKKQLDAYYQLSNTQKEILSALWNIHTETVDLEKRFQQEFYERYLDWNLTQTGHANRELEARIYVGVQTALFEYFSTHLDYRIEELGTPLKDALLNVFLLMSRVEKLDEAKAALEPFIR